MKRVNDEPIRTDPAFVESIHLFCKELARNYELNNQKSSPELIAKLTRVLLESEQKIGGPYFEKGVDPYITNFAIMEFTRLIGISLPSIKAYTYARRPPHLKENEELKNLNSFLLISLLIKMTRKKLLINRVTTPTCSYLKRLVVFRLNFKPNIVR